MRAIELELGPPTKALHDPRAALAGGLSNRIAFLLGDVVALALAYGAVLAFCLYVDAPYLRLPWKHVLPTEITRDTAQILIICALVIVYLVCHGHYGPEPRSGRDASRIWDASLFGLLASVVAETGLRGGLARHLLVELWLTFPVVALPLRRRINEALLALGIGQQGVLLVVSDQCRARVCQDLLGRLAPDIRVRETMSVIEASERLQANSLLPLLRAVGARRVIVDVDLSTGAGLDVTRELVRTQIPLSFLRPNSDISASLVALAEAQEGSLYDLRDPFGHLSRGTKALMDLAGASAILVLASPFMLLIAALVRLDGGPALFRHSRLGLGGRSFDCLKFRTMVTNSDTLLRQHLATYPAAAHEWEETRKLRDDPRVTTVGRFLRSTSLDELPQLLNVLRREMSLVGPRPIVKQEAALYAEDIAFYYRARPGLTGLWQVSGRSNTTYAARVALDRAYVRTRRTRSDLAILLRTVPAVLLRQGAR